MRKRIGLARAMVTNPRYLILDEPTTGLDPLTAEEVMTFLEMVINRRDVVPITITHDPYCINKLGDYIIMMDNGKIIFSGDKSELEKPSETPEHKFFRSFFL
jgi:phospholipid/cholesterol/gamma-HCH transport system ATP-binding protein